MRLRTKVVVGMVVGVACLAGERPAVAAPKPTVVSIIEGRDTSTNGVALLIVGKSLTKFTSFALRDTGGTDVGAVVVVSKSAAMLALRLPPSVVLGEYDLALTYNRTKQVVVRVALSAGSVPPGSLTPAAVGTSLRADLDDAATLGGFSASAFAFASQSVPRSGGAMTGALTVNTAGTSITSTTSSSSGLAVSGRATSATGNSVGVRGEAAGSAGAGVAGYSTATSGKNFGVYGEAASTDGQGVYGFVSSATGATVGVRGESASSAGVGVAGAASSATGTTAGVTGVAASPDGTGILGVNLATTGEANGVVGITSSTTGNGVKGLGATTGYSNGVEGESASTTGAGVRGTSTSTTGSGWGVLGRSKGSAGIGVAGTADSTSGLTTGVFGSAASSSGVGVNGYATSTTGATTGTYGAADSSNGFGVLGYATSATGFTVGVGGYSESSSGAAVYAEARGSGANSVGLSVDHQGSTGQIANFYSNSSRVARIDKSGRGYFNGGTATSGADFAESVATREPVGELAPGDVVAIDPTGVRRFTLCRDADSALVAGIYSTRPGVLARPGDVATLDDLTRDEIPLAVTGIVPCKVCDEGGPIRAGDLLVSASIPGYAKRAPANPAPGTILAKSLGNLATGTGRVEVLITMR